MEEIKVGMKITFDFNDFDEVFSDILRNGCVYLCNYEDGYEVIKITNKHYHLKGIRYPEGTIKKLSVSNMERILADPSLRKYLRIIS